MLDAVITLCVATHQPVANHPRCGRYWGVVHTHPNAERWAASNLQRQGFTPWLLTRTVLTRDPVTHTMTRSIKRPMFTSYLFVDIQSNWVPIRYAPGVNRLMMNSQTPYILPDGAVVRLEAVEALAATQPPKDAPWRPGDAVAPRMGPFQGLPGVVLAAEEDEAVVGILFLGQLREIRYPFDALVARQDY
jgi:transcription antitermination factor NusG